MRNELSSREIEVLQMVVQGTGNKKIANDLYISESTVKIHLCHIMEKLHAANRTHATACAISRGLASYIEP